MLPIGVYFFKYRYTSFVHNDKKVETNIFFAVVGTSKQVIKTNVALYFGRVHEINLEICQQFEQGTIINLIMFLK